MTPRPGLAWIPPLLLAGVACMQITLAERVGLSPWKGGGFGMFASTDGGSARHVTLTALGEEGWTRLPLPADLGRLWLAARVLPSQGALEALGSEVLRRARAEGTPLDAVRVAVWRTRLDLATKRPVRSLVREVEVRSHGNR